MSNFLYYDEFCTNKGRRRKNIGKCNKFRHKNQLTEKKILKPAKALSVRAFISVLNEIYCGFAVVGDFSRGFSVSNRPRRHPQCC